MAVGGEILFLDLKVRDYMAPVALGRYFVLMKEDNRKLTLRERQN